MKSLKELLNLVLEKLELHKKNKMFLPICTCIYLLHKNKEIDHRELFILESHLKANKPKSRIKMPTFWTFIHFEKYGMFWFTREKMQPRIDFIKFLIKEENERNNL